MQKSKNHQNRRLFLSKYIFIETYVAGSVLGIEMDRMPSNGEQVNKNDRIRTANILIYSCSGCTFPTFGPL